MRVLLVADDTATEDSLETIGVAFKEVYAEARPFIKIPIYRVARTLAAFAILAVYSQAVNAATLIPCASIPLPQPAVAQTTCYSFDSPGGPFNGLLRDGAPGADTGTRERFNACSFGCRRYRHGRFPRDDRGGVQGGLCGGSTLHKNP